MPTAAGTRFVVAVGVHVEVVVDKVGGAGHIDSGGDGITTAGDVATAGVTQPGVAGGRGIRGGGLCRTRWIGVVAMAELVVGGGGAGGVVCSREDVSCVVKDMVGGRVAAGCKCK